MIQLCQQILAVCFAYMLPFMLHAEVPVVDESDHFATYDQHKAAEERPLAHDRNRSEMDNEEISDSGFDDEKPLARDTTHHGSNNNASLFNQIQSLQQEIQELRGQLEVQHHEIKLLKEQQLSFYKDIDARLHNTTALTPTTSTIMPEATPPSDTMQPSSSTASPNHAPEQHPIASVPQTNVIPVTHNAAHPNNPADEQIRYLAAYDLIKTKRFDDATIAMQSFINEYPKSGYAANAHYWLGELYMTQKNYPNAIQQFTAVLQQFPSASKAAPSRLKIAYALAASGKKQDAIIHLKQVIKQYPDTHTAKLAGEKLKSLNR